MPEPTKEQREELLALKREYAARLGARLRGIEEAVGLGENWNADRVESLYHQVHRLGGSAAVYGFIDVSRAAQALETALLAWMERPPADQQDLQEELASLLKELSRAAQVSRS